LCHYVEGTRAQGDGASAELFDWDAEVVSGVTQRQLQEVLYQLATAAGTPRELPCIEDTFDWLMQVPGVSTGSGQLVLGATASVGGNPGGNPREFS